MTETVYVLSAKGREGYMKKIKTFTNIEDAKKAKIAMLKKDKYCNAKIVSRIKGGKK